MAGTERQRKLLIASATSAYKRIFLLYLFALYIDDKSFIDSSISWL